MKVIVFADGSLLIRHWLRWYYSTYSNPEHWKRIT